MHRTFRPAFVLAALVGSLPGLVAAEEQLFDHGGLHRLRTALWTQPFWQQPESKQCYTYDFGCVLASDQSCTQALFDEPTEVAAPAQLAFDAPEMSGPADRAAIDLIKRKTGVNVFQGTIFDDPNLTALQFDQQPTEDNLAWFDSVLGRLAERDEQPQDTRQAMHLSEQPPRANATALTGTDVVRLEPIKCSFDVAADSHDTAASYARTGHRELHAVESLRDASYQLEADAQALEEQDRYEEADALRDSARELREKARAMRGHTAALSEPAMLPTAAEAAMPEAHAQDGATRCHLTCEIAKSSDELSAQLEFSWERLPNVSLTSYPADRNLDEEVCVTAVDCAVESPSWPIRLMSVEELIANAGKLELGFAVEPLVVTSDADCGATCPSSDGKCDARGKTCNAYSCPHQARQATQDKPVDASDCHSGNSEADER